MRSFVAVCCCVYCSVLQCVADAMVCRSVTWLTRVLQCVLQCVADAMVRMGVTWLSRGCFMAHSSKTWLIYLKHDSFIQNMILSSKTWLIYPKHDSFIWGITHSWVLPTSWLIHVCLRWISLEAPTNVSCLRWKSHASDEWVMKHPRTCFIHGCRSLKRSDWKYLDLQISTFYCVLFWVTGTPVYSRTT